MCAVLVLVVIIYIRWLQRSPAYASGIDAHDDVRENIIHYDEEGVGEWRVTDSIIYGCNQLQCELNEMK